MRRLLCCLFPLLALPGIAEEPSPSPPPPSRAWTISAECEMVILPQKTMLSILADFRDEAKADEAWTRVQKLIETGEATLVADFTPKGAQGQSLVSESVEQVRYPTEFDPPQLPDKMPAANAAEALKAWPAVAITPTTFDSRKVGQMLELNVRADDSGQALDAEVTLQDVRFLHWEKFEAGELANGDRLTVQQPAFHSMKDTTSLRLRNGQKILAGVHKVPGEGNAFELFLLQITVAPAGGKK